MVSYNTIYFFKANKRQSWKIIKVQLKKNINKKVKNKHKIWYNDLYTIWPRVLEKPIIVCKQHFLKLQNI